MKQLLCERLSLSGVSKDLINAFETSHSQDFYLSDHKACAACKKKFVQRANCDEHTLRVNVQSPVMVFDWDQFLTQNQIDGDPRCDFLMYGPDETHRRIAFCDLSCLEDKYVGQKRAKVKVQAEESIIRWTKDLCLSVDLVTYAIREVVFGRRNPLAKPITPRLEQAESAFLQSCSTQKAIIRTAQIVNGLSYDFVEVPYDAAYVWDESMPDISAYTDNA